MIERDITVHLSAGDKAARTVKQSTLHAKETDTNQPGKVARTSQSPYATHPAVHPILQLQRHLGNRAVTRLIQAKPQVEEPSYGTAAREALAGEPEPNQDPEFEEPVIDQLETGPLQTTETPVSATFTKGSASPVSEGSAFSPEPDASVAEQVIAPTASPTVQAGGGNSCTPGKSKLDWKVVADGGNWRADVSRMTVSGVIHITDWSNYPTTTRVPNTVNPTDNGNINNTPGSPNYWQAAIEDMANYDTAGGGAGPNWHSTEASRAHEWAHWYQDYLGDAVPTGNWAQANLDIDKMTVPKSAYADEAAAHAALRPKVLGRHYAFTSAVNNRYTSLLTTDVPGKGGRGYAAGSQVLKRLIAAVRAYAASKSWK